MLPTDESPGGSTAFSRHCKSRWVLVNAPSFSAWPAAGKKKTSVSISSVFNSPRSISAESRQNQAGSVSTMSRMTSHFSFASALRCKRVFCAPTAEFCPIRNMPSIFPSSHLVEIFEEGMVGGDFREPVVTKIVFRRRAFAVVGL